MALITKNYIYKVGKKRVSVYSNKRDSKFLGYIKTKEYDRRYKISKSLSETKEEEQIKVITQEEYDRTYKRRRIKSRAKFVKRKSKGQFEHFYSHRFWFKCFDKHPTKDTHKKVYEHYYTHVNTDKYVDLREALDGHNESCDYNHDVIKFKHIRTFTPNPLEEREIF